MRHYPVYEKLGLELLDLSVQPQIAATDDFTEQYRNAASQRSSIYLYLSNAFHFPSQEVVRGLRAEENLAALDAMREIYLVPASLAVVIDSFRKKAASDEDVPDLQVEYTRLFVGPFRAPAPPYESLYRGIVGQMMGESTLEVRETYREEGIDLCCEVRDLPDHIIPELEFMAYLSEEETLSWEQSDIEKAMRYLEKQDRFLSDHLTQWLPGFSQAVCKASKEEWYGLLACLTDRFILLDRDFVRAVLSHLKREGC
jgi:putative dimethyl sulfoxide reductase chaperone